MFAKKLEEDLKTNFSSHLASAQDVALQKHFFFFSSFRKDD